jgi:hypothetical protein
MSDINQTIIEVVNGIIASESVQGITFNTSSGCSKVSILNDIEFCDEVSYKYSYEEHTLDQACIDVCNSLKAAAYETCDIARQACKSPCGAIDWTCDGCCSDGCNDMSADCKNGANSAFNSCADGCGYLTITGGAAFKLNAVTGCGGLRITSIDAMVPKDETNTIFAVNMSLLVPSVTAYSHYKLWQDPIPAIEGDENVYANNIPGTATGTLTKVCEGENTGYYLHIESLNIQVPTDTVDTAGLITLANSIGLEVSIVTNGIVDLNAKLFSWVNSFLSTEVKSVLNDILDSTKIMDADC